ncbi:MAG TPA: excinuclease ABC subunit UvrA, partial [Candidatus Binatia bacterium]|nr:excinuclease ABC subunit UvrA [Candidatus Binatia bacterium]
VHGPQSTATVHGPQSTATVHGPRSSIQSPRSGGASVGEEAELLITFDLPLTEKLSLEESLALVSKQGYQRLLLDGEIIRLEEAVSAKIFRGSRPAQGPGRLSGQASCSLTVVQDRLKLDEANRARFIEACEQAYHFGKGKLAISELSADGSKSKPTIKNLRLFSNRLHCADCDIEYRDPSPALFSFNNPVGACPTCRGFGRTISIDYNVALPDRSKTLAQGVVKPWQTGHGIDCQRDLLRTCRHFGIPSDVPFEKLPKKWQNLVIEGEPDYGKDEEHEWPRAWYGVKGYFRWLESKAYKMHVRVLLSRYRAYTPCPDCQGKRFQPEALLYRVRVEVQSPQSTVHSPQSTVHSPRSTVHSPRSTVHGPQSTVQSPESTVQSPQSIGSDKELSLADFYQLPIRDALPCIEGLATKHQLQPNDPLGLVLNEVRSRLGYLNEVGLGYLTLDRPTRSLSGGETERVNLTTCLGTRLVNTLFVLDEPSVGLHPRDTERLVRILQQLRDAGNTVVVVEHEASVMRAANRIVDLGPGHGAAGGAVVFQGSYAEILKSRDSVTGQYLSGRKQVEIPERRNAVQLRPAFEALTLNEAATPFGTRGVCATKPRGREGTFTPAFSTSEGERKNLRGSLSARRFMGTRDTGATLRISQATLHNLKDLEVEIPLGRFVCVTGVSGSGKTTLVREVLLPALATQLKSELGGVKASERLDSQDSPDETEGNESSTGTRHGPVLTGAEHLGRVVLVDQSILGKTPRSNPAVYVGAFDDLRDLFAQSDLAKQRGLNASAFSFNSSQGQCERCRGAGFEKIEMQFLSDVFIRCPDCNGRRYRPHILEIRISPQSAVRSPQSTVRSPQSTVRSPQSTVGSPQLSIADLLEATVDEAIDFLGAFPESRPARRGAESLKLLQEVGLGYLKLGQPINTLSGGESQRLKLVRHLAEAAAAPGYPITRSAGESEPSPAARVRPTLYLFDEPTTGLHFDDVRVLLKVFQRLVDAGHSVLVIEHNLDVIKSADWLIDLGPEAGDQGGQIVAQGTPEQVAECPESHTGEALREVLVQPFFCAKG